MIRIASLFFLALALLSGCSRSDNEAASNDPAANVPEGMVWIPGGEFLMGSQNDFSLENETPRHPVRLKGFYMDITEVTNAQFRAFVEATGYVTIAEKAFDPKDYPDAPPGTLDAGSLLFTKTEGPVPLDDHMRWWRFQAGANWRHPEGAGSDIEGKDNHPVVCVTWQDAKAYATWAGKRLPTEAEWEFAARAGKDTTYTWGDSFEVDGKIPANLWQGDFPYNNTGADGFLTTAPVKSFPPNGFGLYDISGNVWEFVEDWYDPDYYLRSPEFSPPGPEEAAVLDMSRRLRATSDVRPQLASIPHKVIRGGSFLCNDCYCRGYRATARQITDTITSTNHTGFRCVKSPK